MQVEKYKTAFSVLLSSTVGLAVVTAFIAYASVSLTPTTNSQPHEILGTTSEFGYLKVYVHSKLVNKPDIVLEGTKPRYADLYVNGKLRVEGEPFDSSSSTNSGSSTSGSGDQTIDIVPWQIGYRLQEGGNTIALKAVSPKGNIYGEGKVGIRLDTQSPSCKLSYSKNPAPAGKLTIKLSCTETIVPAPKISINQPGSVDVISASMQGSGSTWSFDYLVHTANGSEYRDGDAKIHIITNGDPAGNPLSGVSNAFFRIDTSTDSTFTSSDEPKTDDSTTVTESVENEYEDSLISEEFVPEVDLRDLRERDLASAYRNGSVIKLVLTYEISSVDTDKNTGEFVYPAGESTDSFSGVYVDLSRLDSNYKGRPIRVSARQQVRDNIFARTIQYRISDGNTLSKEGKGIVVVRYLINGKRLDSTNPVELKLVAPEQERIKVEQVNQVNIQEVTEPTVAPEIIREQGYKIKGSGPPNTKIIIRIYSEPITAEVVTDDQGNWEYIVTEELASGSHSVYAALASEDQLPEDFVEVLSFEVAAAEGETDDGDTTITELTSGELDELNERVSNSSPLQFVLVVFVALTVLSGIATLYIFVRSRSRGEGDLFN